MTLGISSSSAGRLGQRMEESGLLMQEPNPDSTGDNVLLVTEGGRRLAAWIRGRRRAVLAQGLDSMTPDGIQALARGLRELADALG
jgi:DNA-binding MarR family transcriptional regulator